jgi:hypothetical protein
VLASVRYLTSRKYTDASEVIVITRNKDTRFVFAEATAVAVPQLFIAFAFASILCR